jgi:hypothetical protein
LVQAFLKKWGVESDFKAPNLPLSLRLKVSGCHYNSIYNNMKDPNAGIFFKRKDGGIDWLWTIIEETVDLYINDTKEFTNRGGVWTFDNTQRKVIQSSPIGLDIGLKRSMVTGVLIVYNCFKETVITTFSCTINNRFVEPEEDDS